MKHVVRVIDGDTCHLAQDVGYDALLSPRLRLAIVDTPERGHPGFVEATDFLSYWLELHLPNLRVRSYKRLSDGRYLADVYDSVFGTTASSALLEAGLATVWV